MLTLHFQSSGRIIYQKEYKVPSLIFISLENPCMIATISYDAEDALEQNIISDCDADLS